MWLRFTKLPTSEGRGPDSELDDKSKDLERSGSLKISVGIELFRRLLARSRDIRFFSFPKLVGIAPSRLAFCAYNSVNLERFPIDVGMRPDT